MARSIRIQAAGAYDHVMARGNRREDIFHDDDDDDRRFFLRTPGQACAMTGWRVHAWVLMRNHYHLFIHTPEANGGITRAAGGEVGDEIRSEREPATQEAGQKGGHEENSRTNEAASTGSRCTPPTNMKNLSSSCILTPFPRFP